VVVFILNINGSISFNIKGLGLLMVAVISATGYNLILARLIGTYSPVYIVNVQNLLGAILFLPLFLIFDFKQFISLPLTFIMFKPVIELSVFASCCAFILYAWSARNVGITKTNIFTNSIPLFTAIFSFILLGETMTIQNIVGMVIVVTGIFMSQINGMKKDVDEALALTGKTA
jgi:drug/metabolite transporter (DMT)-like permease